MFQASHVMTRSLITLSPGTSVTEAIRVLLKNRISGAPVVDQSGQLIGIISEFKLLEVAFDEATASMPVGEVMTREVITVDEDTPLTDLSQAFISLRVRRLPVVKDGKLVGQVSRRDVLRCVVNEEGNDVILKTRDDLVHQVAAAN